MQRHVILTAVSQFNETIFILKQLIQGGDMETSSISSRETTLLGKKTPLFAAVHPCVGAGLRRCASTGGLHSSALQQQQQDCSPSSTLEQQLDQHQLHCSPSWHCSAVPPAAIEASHPRQAGDQDSQPQSMLCTYCNRPRPCTDCPLGVALAAIQASAAPEHCIFFCQCTNCFEL